MLKGYLSEHERRRASLEKRMDRFDAVVCEHLRSSKSTAGELAFKMEVDVSTLWRYRNKVEAFEKAPFITIAAALKECHASAVDRNYICGW